MNIRIGNLTINANGNPEADLWAIEIFDDKTQVGLLISTHHLRAVSSALSAISQLVELGTQG